MADALYDVIIPTYNQTALTVACVESLARMPEAEHSHLIWVDNGSTQEHCQNVYGCISRSGLSETTHFLPENRGFPKAVNLGLALSTAPYVVLLNNDVMLYPGVFDAMRRACERTQAAMCGCVAVEPDDSLKRGWQDYKSLIQRGWIKRLDDIDSFRLLERAEHLAFFCTMLTRACTQRIGYLTEAVGMAFGEDDDYNERVHAAGMQRVLCLGVHVEHVHRATARAIWTPAELAAQQKKACDILLEKYGERVW